MCLCVGVAAANRWTGGSAALPVVVLAACAVLLLVRVSFVGRRRELSDPTAARLDEAAGLGGELRSAGWFALRDARDGWAELHLDRAARRIQGADWTGLYPAASARRAKAVTALFAVCTLALALGPAPRNVRGEAVGAPGGALRAEGAESAEQLLPELQKQLEALLAAAERGGAAPAAASASASQLRALIARLTALRDAGRLEDLARAMAQSAGGRSDDPAKALKAIADRARTAARTPGVAPEAREALERIAEMTDSARAADPRADEAAEAVSSAQARKSDATPGTKQGEVDEMSIQSVSEAEAGGGGGVIMMGSEDDASGKAAPGLGLGGGSDARTDAGRMADLDAALRRETVEASIDAPGQSVETDARRKTEHGEATVTYARTAAGTFDRGRAVAPPPVPESRRTAVQTYFIRKP